MEVGARGFNIIQETFDLAAALRRAFARVLTEREQAVPTDQFLAALCFLLAEMFVPPGQDRAAVLQHVVAQFLDPQKRDPGAWRAMFVAEILAKTPPQTRAKFFITCGASACLELVKQEKPVIYQVGRDAMP